MKVIFVTATVFLVLSMSSVSTKACTDDASFTTKLASVAKGQQIFNISTSYCLDEMTIGRKVTVTVRIESLLGSNTRLLEIKGVPTASREDIDRIKFSPSTPETEDTASLSIRKYSFPVEITDRAEPRKYAIQLDLGLPDSDPDKERVQRSFDLCVGVNSKGKLEIQNAQASQPLYFKAAMFSPRTQEFRLKLRNLFRDYTTNIESISVRSDPPGWILPIEKIPLKDEVSVPPTGEKTVSFNFETAPLTDNLIGLGGAPPQLRFDIVYNDGYRRQITYDEGRQHISIAPTSQVLIGAVAFGLVFGAIIRAVLEFMLFKKKITRSGVIRVVSYSLLFGLLVVIFAAAGQVEVKSKTFSLSSSYDNPLAMLVIGLISALAGLQIIIGWYKSLKSD